MGGTSSIDITPKQKETDNQNEVIHQRSGPETKMFEENFLNISGKNFDFIVEDLGIAELKEPSVLTEFVTPYIQNSEANNTLEISVKNTSNIHAANLVHVSEQKLKKAIEQSHTQPSSNGLLQNNSVGQRLKK